MLLEKRQSHLTGDNGDCDDRDSISSGNVMQNSVPIFQGLLMKFLDNDAPVLGKIYHLNVSLCVNLTFFVTYF